MNVPVKIVGMLAIALIVAGGSVAYAAHQGTNKPLVLVDAEGTFLGNIIGAGDYIDRGPKDAQETLYVTYVPSIDGILRYRATTGGTDPASFGTTVTIGYSLPDCQGDAYDVYGATIQQQWVVKGFDGKLLKPTDTAVENMTIQSWGTGSSGGYSPSCNNESVTYPYAVLLAEVLSSREANPIGPLRVVQ